MIIKINRATRSFVLLKSRIRAVFEVRIPAQAGHRFRRKPDTDSGASRTLIPAQAGH
jgi:hypothetical protein